MSSIPRRYEEMTQDEWNRLETIKVVVPDEIGMRLWKSFDEDRALSMHEVLRKAREWLKKRDDNFRSKHDNNVMAVIDKTRGEQKRELIQYWKQRYAWLMRRLKSQGIDRVQFVDGAYGGYMVQYFKGASRVKVNLKRNVRKRIETEEQLDDWEDVFETYDGIDDWYDRQPEYCVNDESLAPYVESVRVESAQKSLEEFVDKEVSDAVINCLGGDKLE